MNKRKYASIILSALCLTACGNKSVDEQKTTTVESTLISEETTTKASSAEIIVDEENEIVILPDEEAIEEPYEPEETAPTYDTGNSEEGLVYFVQPSIMLYPRYKVLDEWECRDGEVMGDYDYHYYGEWKYSKELIFVFSNFSDEPMTVDSIQIVRDSDETPMTFTNGSDTLDINFTIQPLHKTDYLLTSEDFDYSACESGIYRTVADISGEKIEFKFFINNTELYSEKYISETDTVWDENDNRVPYEYDVFAPTFLTEEQQKIFAKAQGVMSDWFWCSRYMEPEYADTHTPDEFMQRLYSVFTKEYADELSRIYIDENGNFVSIGGDRGSDISYYDHCFLPVSADENTVEFKAIVIYCHSDGPYEVSFEDNFHYVLKNTEDGWRVDRFDIWS